MISVLLRSTYNKRRAPWSDSKVLMNLSLVYRSAELREQNANQVCVYVTVNLRN